MCIALEILYAIEKNDVTIVVGETGSGKSTKLPQFLVQAGYASPTPTDSIVHSRMIAVTLPKRVSVLNISQRLAFNLNSQLGEQVGYSIRFDTNKCKEGVTQIKVMTDGMLVREMMSDPLLRGYKVIVVDDCHERSLYTDIILGLLKKIRVKRREMKDDLKIVISSATLEADLFLRYFSQPDKGFTA